MVAISIHFYRDIDRLEEGVSIDSRQDEASLVKGFRALGRSTDADSGEWMTYTVEEAALFRECTGVGNHSEGIHLQAVIIMEPQWLMLNHQWIQRKVCRFEALLASGMAGVENRHLVLFCQPVDGIEKREEILLCIYIFFSMGREKHVFPFGQTEPLVDIA